VKRNRSTRNGYVIVRVEDHPRADAWGYVPEHVLVVEQVLGRFLFTPVQIHHVNRNRKDNRPANLVVCPDDAYHRIIEMRGRALDACGHADWRKCCYCASYDDPALMQLHTRGRKTERYTHTSCARAYWRAKRRLTA
jgi:HNH endonuclease